MVSFTSVARKENFAILSPHLVTLPPEDRQLWGKWRKSDSGLCVSKLSPASGWVAIYQPGRDGEFSRAGCAFLISLDTLHPITHNHVTCARLCARLW